MTKTPDGLDMAQEAMLLGEIHGWAMTCSPGEWWTQLVMTRGAERLELAWKTRIDGRGWRLADSRLYTDRRRTRPTERRSFTYARALRWIRAAQS